MWSLLFLFLSYLDRNFNVTGEFLSDALDAEKEGALNGTTTVCAKMSTVGENLLYRVSDGVEEVRSVVNPAGELVDCSVIVDRVRVKSCSRLESKERRLETPFTRNMDEARRRCLEFNAMSAERTGRRTASAVKQPGEDGDDDDDDDDDDQVKARKRAKRGFTYPGTLWCGAGNMADHYDHLGEFAETDSCCRVHDHCPHVIHAFSSNYGYTNFKWHSICHCDCDNALKGCLRKVNDTASRVVGQAFFNVIGVPCFDFNYEDQCVERHWYGLCKRYEKLPVAVMRESVPYDFGGVDVIDVLTAAPLEKKSSEKINEKLERPASGSQTGGGPEEPSLGNVVTATKDFIKVLATVSTSQSSTADTAKGETQSSEKKKKQKKKKRKNKKKKHKGKGNKRKLKVDTGAKVEEGATVSPSGGKAEEVKSNFISEAAKNDQSSRNTNRFIDSKYDFGGNEEPSNEVLKDEPMKDEEAADVSITSPTVQKERVAAVQDTNALNTETIPLSASTTASTATPHQTKTPRPRKGEGRRRKENKLAPIPSSVDVLNVGLKEKSPVNATNNLSNISAPGVVTITPRVQLERQKELVSAASTPIVIPKLKRHRSKERAEGEGRKKRRKAGSAAPIVAQVITSTTIPSIPTADPTERQVSHRPDIHGGRGQRNRRGKIVLPLSSENPPDFQNASENVLPVLPTPQSAGLLDSPTAPTVVNWPTEGTESERGTLISVTVIPSVTARRRRPTVREERKPRKKAAPAVLNTHTPMTFARRRAPATPSEADKTGELNLRRSESSEPVSSVTTTTTTPFMSQIQLSIQRAKEQFSRKKRRKATLSNEPFGGSTE